MTMKLTIPAWLDQTLLIKIAIFLAIALGGLIWFKRHEAKIAEEYLINGVKQGTVIMEGKYVKQWEVALEEIHSIQDQYLADSKRHAAEVAKTNAKIDLLVTSMQKLTAVTLTMDERQKNYEDARRIPPDQLDAALLEITRQIRDLEAKQQPEP